jgi:hypothetical protein
MTALPPAPPWNWHETAVCCICAPHCGILISTDSKFLWRLTRYRQPPQPRQVERLDRIVGQLDAYAQEVGIVWP